MTTGTKQNLSLRFRNVLQRLCDEYEALPDNAPVPSLRKIKNRFGIGSVMAEEIMHHLCRKYGLRHEPRKKIRKPASSKRQLQHTVSGETTLCMMSDMGYFWEPILQDFNSRHKQKIFVRYLTYLNDFLEEMAHPTCDFYLFPTNPIFLEIVRDSHHFVDLKIMMSKLDQQEYYPSVFLRDASQKTWGIAPNLILDVLCVRREVCHLPSCDLNWDEFGDILRQVKTQYAGKIDHALVFPCYHSIMTHLGLRTINPDTLAFDASTRRYGYVYKYMQELLDKKLAPYVSNSLNLENDISRFYRGNSVFHVFSHTRIPPCLPNDMDFRPLPARNPACRKVQSEVFAISASSMNYERAWSFIQFVLSKEIQRQMLDSLRVMPAMRELCPPNLTKSQFRLFSQALQKTVRHCEDSLFTISMQKFFDSSFDRCMKYGGELSQVLKETRLRYETYWGTRSDTAQSKKRK